MSNRINNWEQLLEMANKDLKGKGAELIFTLDDDGYCGLKIKYDIGGTFTDTYAENYYEDELSDLINEAWSHARIKIGQLKQYNGMARHSEEVQGYSME